MMRGIHRPKLTVVEGCVRCRTAIRPRRRPGVKPIRVRKAPHISGQRQAPACAAPGHDQLVQGRVVCQEMAAARTRWTSGGRELHPSRRSADSKCVSKDKRGIRGVAAGRTTATEHDKVSLPVGNKGLRIQVRPCPARRKLSPAHRACSSRWCWSKCSCRSSRRRECSSSSRRRCRSRRRGGSWRISGGSCRSRSKCRCCSRSKRSSSRGCGSSSRSWRRSRCRA